MRGGKEEKLSRRRVRCKEAMRELYEECKRQEGQAEDARVRKG
jgi:hypothetical protein